jgi:hypothetical protein
MSIGLRGEQLGEVNAAHAPHMFARGTADRRVGSKQNKVAQFC